MIIFGLGNPEDRFLMTRHNAGFMVVDALARYLKARFRLSGNKLVAKASYKGEDIKLIKPLSYMNNSGRIVARVVSRSTDDYLVVVDDVDLEFGKLRLRKQGGTSGHNGLASIRDHLGTDEFPRLRIGVGPRPDGADLSDYVLSNFTRSEVKQLEDIIGRAGDTILLAVTRGIDAAMNEVNAANPCV